MSKPASKPAVAAEVWRRLFDFFISTAAQRGQVLGRYELTPNDSRALFTLDTTGKTMQALATEWACDPSNATFIVDRLEKRRLAARGAQAGDRRVKLVTLTARGVKTKASLTKEFYEPPPELLALELSDLEVLHLAAAKLQPRPPAGRQANSVGTAGASTKKPKDRSRK